METTCKVSRPTRSWTMVERFGRGFLVGLLAGPALASRPLMPPEVPANFRQECSACHVAYPPGLLPAASWDRLMKNLGAHFGTDASLDEAQVRLISDWLRTHAGTYKRVSGAPPDDRITQSAWFIRKHQEVPPDAWKRASIRSAANCNACHSGAARGDYDEHGVRIPR